MVIVGTKKRVGKTTQWIQELRANAPKSAVYYSPEIEQYFDSQFMNVAFKDEGRLVQIERKFRDSLVTLTNQEG